MFKVILVFLSNKILTAFSSVTVLSYFAFYKLIVEISLDKLVLL